MNHGWRERGHGLGPDAGLASGDRRRRRRPAPRRRRAASAAAAADSARPARRSTVTPGGRRASSTAGRADPVGERHDASRRPCRGTRSPMQPRDQVGRACRGPAPARRAAAVASVANSTRISVRRRSKASGSAGQRTAASRFQNGSGSVGSWSRIASPRSRSSRPGVAWTWASCTSSRRMTVADRPRIGTATRYPAKPIRPDGA